jgi:hypothetical protein
MLLVSLYKKVLTGFLFFISLFIISISCDSTEPPPPDEKTTLEYNWEVDTLFNPHGYGVVPWSMWGSSPTDVWTVGFNLAGQGEMFHYDGALWKRVTPDLGFNYGLAAIFGFSESDIYAVGSKLIVDTMLHSENLVLKYNGINWQRENMPLGSGLLYIHGLNTNNIWVCGYYGTLYHKTSNVWQKMPFDSKLNLGPIWTASTGEVFMMSEYFDYPITVDTAMFYFSKYNSSTWQILDSNKLIIIDGIRTGYKFGEKGMIGISENQIYSVGIGGLFEFNGVNNSLIYWDDYYYRDIKNNMNGNIFVVGDHGTINYSINNQWKTIRDYNRYVVDFYSVMPFQNEIFIGAFSGGNGYIVHGTLKK